MKVLLPFSTQLLPLRVAVQRAPPASEPEPGSVSPHAPSHSPLASLGMYLCFWSSLPAMKMWFEHSELCAATVMPTEPSTRESSSTAMTYSTYPRPAPPYSAGKIMPSTPMRPSSLIVSKGKWLASSHFITLGRISRSANSRMDFLSCSCSSVSWKSISHLVLAAKNNVFRQTHHYFTGRKEAVMGLGRIAVQCGLDGSSELRALITVQRDWKTNRTSQKARHPESRFTSARSHQRASRLEGPCALLVDC